MLVAAQIEAGTGDAGMGIYSAAKLYGLDFVLICTKQYDLLIPDAAWDTPMVRQMLDVLQSGDFREKMESMGVTSWIIPGRSGSVFDHGAG